ncbi:hypothetical protein HNR07_000559 [Nocardiopsis metallicus]|uniref:Uncharacterized protein n=1 Tax=Nocardiopsis metallicus TaxID=179819 RepID=A0A840W035_9ACTN|nr:hypothetical protein [Nocardiopsis metallicus]
MHLFPAVSGGLRDRMIAATGNHGSAFPRLRGSVPETAHGLAP